MLWQFSKGLYVLVRNIVPNKKDYIYRNKFGLYINLIINYNEPHSQTLPCTQGSLGMRLNYSYWLVMLICIVPIPRIIGGGAVGPGLVLSVTPTIIHQEG